MSIAVAALPRFVNPGVNNQDVNPANLRYSADFSSEETYEIDLTLQQQQGLFGVPRSVYVNNGRNPNNVELTISNTLFKISIPAYAIGFFPIDAKENDKLSFYSLGGSSEKVEIRIYNYSQEPAVWYTTDPLAPGFDVQAVDPAETAFVVRSQVLAANTATDVFPATATPRNVEFTNKTNAIMWWRLNGDAAANIATSQQLMPGETFRSNFRTDKRISFLSVPGGNIQAFEWTAS